MQSSTLALQAGMLCLSLTNGNIIAEGKNLPLEDQHFVLLMRAMSAKYTSSSSIRIEASLASNLSSEGKYFHVNPSCAYLPAKSPEENLLCADFLFHSDTCSVRRKVPLARAVLFSCFMLGHTLISFEGRL